MPRCHLPWCPSPALDDDALNRLARLGSLCHRHVLSTVPVYAAYRRSKAKTDALDPEATPKTGVTGSSQRHRDAFERPGPPISYLVAQSSHTASTPPGVQSHLLTRWGVLSKDPTDHCCSRVHMP